MPTRSIDQSATNHVRNVAISRNHMREWWSPHGTCLSRHQHYVTGSKDMAKGDACFVNISTNYSMHFVCFIEQRRRVFRLSPNRKLSKTQFCFCLYHGKTTCLTCVPIQKTNHNSFFVLTLIISRI